MILKKLAAIFLFTLFLFNTIGYSIADYFARHTSDLTLEASLDKNLYNESELITIKVPISLPYQNDQREFERVDGEITLNGKIYKYVKRKIENGSLILMCLPDYNKMRLKKEKDDYYKDINSVAQNASSKKQENSKGSSFKNVLSEFYQLQYHSAGLIFEANISHSLSHHKALLLAPPHVSPDQPPEFI